MVKYTVVRDNAFEAFNVKLGVLFEHFCALGATAQVDFLTVNGHSHSRFDWFLSQTGRTDNQITRFHEVSFGICPEHLGTRGATKGMALATMFMHGRRSRGDSKSDQGTATRSTDECVHVSTPLER